MKYTLEKVRQVIKEKVEGKIVPQHTSDGHFYKFVETGEVTASVTSKNIIDKPHLVPWAIGLAIEFLEADNRFLRLKGSERERLIKGAKMQYTDVRDMAGTIGGEAHKIIESYEQLWIKLGIKPASIMELIPQGSRPPVIGACRAAEQAFNKYKWTPVAFELLVGVPGIGAGTLDLIVLNEKGELELIDHKTSNNVNDFYSIQTSAYKYFFEKMTGLKINRIRVLKIDKWSDKFKVYNVPNPSKAVKAFKAVSNVYDWLNNREDKLVEDKIIVKI